MAKVAEIHKYFDSAERAHEVIDDVAAQVRPRALKMENRSDVRRSIHNVLARKRMGSVILYTMGALVLAIFCSFVFNFMGEETQFAISIMGSLIGGFLGALLAAALIVDIYSGDRDQERDG